MSTLSGESNTLKENFYDLLGVNKDSSEDQILYEYRIKVREFHPDKNSDPKSALFFQKIQKARKILTDRNLRQLYDTWLSSDLGVSFEEYLRSHKNFEECMHWYSDANETPRMLDGSSDVDDRFLEKYESDLLRKVMKLFRAYEI
uniref:DnaJ (Hsp40) homolog, subfamily C, member 12 n=1 Tax=Schistosoma japonicum TaxID=6182 RepID=Q5DCT0_SCHJA|nr:SJCHGC02203 protein [Schistosoma japonicum]CAX70769.1 DnaJ (Hsp40) homolog, subfamily C, member 12 [Schistosoma japonicum]